MGKQRGEMRRQRWEEKLPVGSIIAVFMRKNGRGKVIQLIRFRIGEFE